MINLIDNVNKNIEIKQDSDLRTHLGASQIGRKCDKEIWLSFRWAKKVLHSGRMLRLFDRGHKEEFRFIEWLKPVCSRIWDLDPKTGEQIRISNYNGHFGGSLDGVIENPESIEYEEGLYLLEFKTHNDKSFKKLEVIGVKEAKLEHYVQMQIYLYHKPMLKAAIYMAINKNDDSLYIERVEKDPDIAKQYLERAGNILNSEFAPHPFEEAYNNNYYCKHFCNYHGICYDNEEANKSCRMCSNVYIENEHWKCSLHDKILSKDDQLSACKDYNQIR